MESGLPGNMRAIEYRRSVPRFLAARYPGRYWKWICTSPLGTTRLAELPEPELPGSEWIRIRPLLSGICGSDLATVTATGSTYFSPYTSCPFVLGHEVAGEVVAAGPDGGEFAVGERVVLEPPLHCRIRGIYELCTECRAGHFAQCRNVTEGCISAGVQTGFCQDTGGGWSRSFVAHPLQLHRVPESLGNQEAVLVEPLSCCLQAVVSAQVKPGHTLLVMGCGTIGILTIAALKQLQPQATVLAVAKYPHQKNWAVQFGAERVFAPGRGLFEELAGFLGSELFHPELSKPVMSGGVNMSFDCVGGSSSIDDCLRFTAARGKVVLVGMPGIPRGIDWTSIWYKELRVVGSYTSTSQIFRKALEMASHLGDRLQGVVGARYPLERFKEGLACALHSGQVGVLKTAFEP